MTARGPSTAYDVLMRLLDDDPASGILARAIASGHLVPDALGRVMLAEAVPMFFDSLRADLRAATATAAVERARAARAASAELRLAEARRDLIPTEDAEAAVDHLCGTVLTALAGLPARITRDMKVRRMIEDSINQCRRAIAEEVLAIC